MVNKNNNSQNKITKECIFDALMILMEQKNFKEISITEITKKAGVSRMAFYRNYHQMEDIITSYLDEFLDEYSKQIIRCGKKDKYESVCLYFAYFRKHEKLITNLIHSKLTNLILERCIEFFHSFSNDIACEKLYTPEEKRYFIEFVAGGLFRVLIEWAKGGMKESDEYMAKIVYNIVKE
jgi:AcrR family transcriptional regulator